MSYETVCCICSYAIVQVEIKNQGDDAFKPEIYGDAIIIERRILESTSSTTLKDRQGKVSNFVLLLFHLWYWALDFSKCQTSKLICIISPFSFETLKDRISY